MTAIPKTLNEFAAFILTQMKDNATTNRLVDGLRNSIDYIKNGIILAIDEFNTKEPVKFNYTLATFPSLSGLIDGVKKHALDGMIEDHLGNDAQFNDGAGPVKDKGKHAEYSQVQMKYEQRWGRFIAEYKLAANIRNAYGDA